jgi:hypothetical protein
MRPDGDSFPVLCLAYPDTFPLTYINRSFHGAG